MPDDQTTQTSQQTTDQQTTDQKTTDQKTTDQQTTDQKTTDQKTTDQQTTDQKTTDQKTTDQQKVEGAPEKYEFKAPEGQTFDPEFLKAYSETAKKHNLSQKAAQEIIDEVGPVIEKQQLARIEAVKQEWKDTSVADKEIGGDKLAENLGIAAKALDKFGSPELKKLMIDTGMGNHPEVIRAFYKIGKAISDDTFIAGHKEGDGVPNTFETMAKKLYS